MSARLLRSTSRSSREETQPSVDDAVKDLDLEDEAALRILRKKLPWRDWVVRDFLRYWFWLAALVIDVFVPWAIGDALNLRTWLGPLVVAALVAGFLIVEITLYRSIWPEGPWKTDKRRRRKKFVKGPGPLDKLLGREK